MAAPRHVHKGDSTAARLHDDLVLRQHSGDDTKIRSVQHVTGAQLAEQLAEELVSLLSLGAHVS